MKIHKLKDDNGILAQTKEILPVEYFEDLLKTLSELEDNECYIDKVSGSLFQVQHADGGYISLCNITSGAEHDEVGKIVKRKKNKFK